MPDIPIAEAMAQDETEFDRLLRETREWEARDRARHPSFGMKEDGGGDSFAGASRARDVTAQDSGKHLAADPGPPRATPPQPQAPTVQTPKPAEAVRDALRQAMKQAQQAKQAQTQSHTARENKKGGWGWIWVLILLYFLFRHFVR